jgi:hypothetical protein
MRLLSVDALPAIDAAVGAEGRRNASFELAQQTAAE